MLPTITKVVTKIQYAIKVDEPSWELQQKITNYLNKSTYGKKDNVEDLRMNNDDSDSNYGSYIVTLNRDILPSQIDKLIYKIPIWCAQIHENNNKKVDKEKIEVEKWLKNYKEAERTNDPIFTKLHVVLIEYFRNVVKEADDKDYSMAHCHMGDYNQLLKIYKMLLRGEKHKKIRDAIRSLDTIVRDDIPTKIYEMICDA